MSVSDVFLHRRILLAMTTLCLLIKVYVPLYIAWNVLLKSTWLNKCFEKFENVNFILLQQILKFSNLGFSEKDFIMETNIWWINLWTVKWWKSESPEIYFGILMPRAIRQFTKQISLFTLFWVDNSYSMSTIFVKITSINSTFFFYNESLFFTL